MRPVFKLLLASSLYVPLAYAHAQSTSVRIVGHVVEPAELEPTAARVASLRLPAGFRIAKFAENLDAPRMIAVAGDSVYVTRRDLGDVVLLRDTNQDGRAEAPIVVARRPQMHGIAVQGDKVYLATVKELYVADRKPDGTLGPLQRIIDDLPDGGQHPNRTLGISPDGMLFISVGSTCNACSETTQESATMLRAKPDGTSRTIYASGLRNTIGFAWHPISGQLFGMDHGIDWLGDDDQREELNQLTQGEQYGWPYIYADGKHNPQDEPPDEIPHETWARMSQPPLLMYTAHAAPMQMAFYDSTQFPADYRGDAFVAMRGSWNRSEPSGYEVVRIRFKEGRPTAIESFVSGFVVKQADGTWGQFGRPAGLAIASDGSLLVSDDTQGVVYRVSYQSAAAGGY